MKLSKRSRWIIIFVLLLISVTILLIQVDSVQATFTNMHAATVLLRVETEIMQKTPAGQYYESLFWKHNDELMQIASQYPENNEEFLRVTRLFVPSLEALLDGEGDTIQITFEQVESLKAELDWLASVGSPVLREDIQKEQQRLPLDAFVGMTMNEALDFINSSWTSNSGVEKNLVPNSDGKWAYLVHNGLYFEYPSNYSVQISGSEKDYIYFIPSQGSPEDWHPCVVKVRIWSVPVTEMNANDPRSWFSHENIVWERAVQNAEFPGVEFISSWSNPSDIDLHAFLYNQEKRIAVEVWVLIMDSQQLPNDLDYSTIVDQQYEYFQHMAETIKLDASSTSEFMAQPTSTPVPALQPTPTYYDIKPNLVPGTDGKWSYYVLNGVYLEFPTNYYLPPQKLSIPSISFMPSEDFPKELDPLYMYADIANVPMAESEKLDPHNWYPAENIVWERVIEINGFKGTELISQMPDDSVMYLSVILYNEESQTAVHLSLPHIPSIPEKSDYMELINQRYPYFQHIVDNIHMGPP